ncbi:MAG: hypothetical protein WCL51_03805 [Bacteroidota bacterium]
MKLYIDFDGTIANSMKRLVEILNQKHGTSHDYKDLKQWDCLDLFPNTNQDEILGIFESFDFYQGLELCEGFDLEGCTIVTIGTAKNLEMKRAWCDLHLKGFKFIGLEKGGFGKSEINMSDGILIDDVTANLDSCNAKYKILYAPYPTEWNEFDFISDNFIATNWDNAKTLIKYSEVKLWK